MAIKLTLEPYKHSFSKERIERKGLDSDEHVVTIGVGRMIVDYHQVSTSNTEELEERKLRILNGLVIANNGLSKLHLQYSQV